MIPWRPLNALLLLLALAALADGGDTPGRSAPDAPGLNGGVRPPDACAVVARSLDSRGEARPARAVSAGQTPVVVLSGRLLREPAGQKPLVFDVFNPSGQRYQVLDSRPRMATVVRARSGLSRRTRVRVHEARLALAGSSIAWTSMYGEWRVVPRYEGAREPCGPAATFTIGP